MRVMVMALLPISALLLCACASVPPQLQGDAFAKIDTDQASTGQWNGSSVRWGGIVTGLRSTDLGSCLEIAYFPTARIDGAPYFGYPGDGLGNLFWQSQRMVDHAIPLLTAYKTLPPRFLACGGQSFDAEASRFGAVITVAGRLGTPQIYQVDLNQCRPMEGQIYNGLPPHREPHRDVPRDSDGRKGAKYFGNVHASNGPDCVVSLPVLEVNRIVAWKVPQYPTFIQASAPHWDQD